VPQESANDTSARLVDVLLPDGAWVDTGTPIAVMETSKAAFEVNAPQAGYVFYLYKADDVVPIGSPLALLSDAPERPIDYKPAVAAGSNEGQGVAERIVTQKAQELIERHGINPEDLPDIPVVRSEDIERLLVARRAPVPKGNYFGDERLDPSEDWDQILQDETYQKIVRVLDALRRRMKAKYVRHVSTGDLLHDRWALAKNYGFGEDSSVYDSCLILGDVTLGKRVWVGPFTVLDGRSAPLSIGDYSSVGSGAQIYTHHTIEQALTAYEGKLFTSPTRVGACCFISPLVVIAPGTTIGDHCFVAAGSYVEGAFPSYSYIEGSPARIVGRVEIKDNKAYLRRNESSSHRGERG
jgi:acetyltransferase-like isoleucine patch superfamily enzyme